MNGGAQRAGQGDFGDYQRRGRFDAVDKTQLACAHDFQGLKLNSANSRDGRYLRFGVREFGMFAVGNGIAAFGLNLIPFTATFLKERLYLMR